MAAAADDAAAVAAARANADASPPPPPLLGPAALPAFALERFFARHEFTAKHLLCCSDCEPLRVRDLLSLKGGGDASAAAEALLSVRLSYTETRGDPALREAIARHVYAKGGKRSNGGSSASLPALDPEREIVTVVPQEGIFLAAAALALRPGELVIVSKPGYESLYRNPVSAGAKVLGWKPREAGRLVFDARDLEALLAPVLSEEGGSNQSPPPPLLRAVFVNFVCHNPTGFLATDALWRDVASLLARADAAQRGRAAARGLPAPPAIVLFSDEMYAHMEPWRDGAAEKTSPPSIASALELTFCGNVSVVALCGVSKSWGCPGLRTGWLASRSHNFIDRVSELRDYTTICSAGPCEHLALAAVEATSELTRRARERVRRNAQIAAAFFGQKWSRAFEWPGAPDAGPICFPAVRDALLEAAGLRDVGELCERLAAKSGVLLLPGTVYQDDGDDQDDSGSLLRLDRRFRLGLGREGFEEGLGALEAWLVEVMGSGGSGGGAAA
jgi:aspartate/methionine/tyrosine aminotransferase